MYHTCENSMLGNSTAQPGHEGLSVGWRGSWLLLVSLAGESQPSNCSHNHLPSDSGSPLLPCLWTLNVMAHPGSSPHLLIYNAITPAKSPWPPTDTSITLRVGNQGSPGSHYSAPEMNTGGIFSSPQIHGAGCLFVQPFVLSLSCCGFHRNRTMAVTCCREGAQHPLFKIRRM